MNSTSYFTLRSLSQFALVSIMISFFSGLAFAQEVWDMNLEELVNVKVVSASRKEANSLQLPSVVTVLSGEELARWGAENLADGLRTAAGMQIRKSQGDFPQYSATIRGNSADFLNVRTLFLIDGIPVRNPNAGFDPGWIPLAIIKQVEIVKGAASNLYGANAFGGVVNVITKTAADMGSENNWRRAGSLGLATEKDVIKKENVNGASGFLNAGKLTENSDIFISGEFSNRENTKKAYPGHQYQDLYGKLIKNLTDSLTLTSSALVSLDRNQIALSNADSSLMNDFVHVTSEAKFKIDANTETSLVASYSGFKHFVNYTDSLDKYDNQGQVFGLSAQYSTQINQVHSIIAGAEYSQDVGSLSTMENDYATFPPTLQSVGWNTKYQNTYGIYSQYEYAGWKQFLPSFGARFDSNSTYGSAISPRVGLSYLYNQNTTLYSSIGQGFRSPVYNETYILGFGKVGNPKLKPEYTTTYEVGIKSVQLATQNTLSLFKEEITRKIDLEAIPSTNLYTYKNFGVDSIAGIEFDGSYKFNSSLRMYYNTTLLRTEKSSGGRIDRMSEQKYVLGADWSFSKFDVDAVVVHESEAYYYNTNPTIPADSEGRVFLPSITVVNLQVKRELSAKTTGALYIDNLMDRTYKEVFSPFIIQNGQYMPGRTIGFKVDSKF